MPTTPALWPARQRLFWLKESKVSRRKSEELRWLATAPRPNIRVRLARLAARVNHPKGSDILRINDVAKTATECGQETVLRYASVPQPLTPRRGAARGQTITRGPK